VTVFDQAGFDARPEWGGAGARVLAGACRVVVVVDVLSFTTAIEVAAALAGGGLVVLAAVGRVAEVRLAAEHDVSRVVPVLRGGAFTAAPPSGSRGEP
jgi:2-phosphosulfolactate phosphatase